MQVNEHTERVQQGKQLPNMDRAFEDAHTLETRADRRGSAESRRTGGQRPEGTRMPQRYGAGF